MSSPNEITTSSEIELRRDEDSVTTLTVGLRRNSRTSLVYAGINSGDEDIRKGKNEHFRVFGVDQASKSKASKGPKMAELSRSGLFESRGTDTYQRLLRLAPASSGSHLVGAAGTGSTGLSKGGEIVIFDVASAGNAAPKPRGRLELPKEAADLDIIQTGPDQWQMAYCDERELSLLDITKAANSEPSRVYTITPDEAIGLKVCPSFRSVRYLTSHSVLTVSNLPAAGGALLHGFRLPQSPGQGNARLAASAKLPKPVKRATGLAVRNLSPPPNPSSPQGDAQFVIAVSAQDYSITLYTLDYQVAGDVGMMTNLYPVTTLKDVHPSPISGLALSYFTPPAPKSGAPRPQHLKLASVGSMGNTVTVHTLPLRRLQEKSASARKGGPPRPARYVLGLKSKAPSPASFLTFVTVAICLLAVLLQGVLEIQGLARPVLGARFVVPESWNRPVPGYQVVTAGATHGFLSDLLARNQLGEGERVILNVGEDNDGDAGLSPSGLAGGIKINTQDAAGLQSDAKEWDDLHPGQKTAWKERLKAAGHWGEDMGESVFKGVLFGNIAGAVGHIVGG